MGQAYFDQGMFEPAAFSLFIRKYPANRGYFVTAGLEDVLDFLENFRFGPEDIEYLRSLGMFSEPFLDYLSRLRFTGEVFAIPEGRLFFKDEPVIEVTAPVIEAQLVESAVINAVNFPVILTAKAARCTYAAQGRGLVDFSLRRTQGTDASLHVARNSYIGGFSATSNVLAGQKYGIPVSGTMAHSFIMSFPDELEALRAFAKTFGSDTVLLIDTYDTIAGAKKAITVARELEARKERLRGVRLDSGDMTDLSKKVRVLFDEAGLEYVKIFASGSYDEFKIRDAVQNGAEIDAFGVGTKMGVSADAPYTDMAYKLVEYAGRPVLKLSTGKQSLPGKKQVFRVRKANRLSKDIIDCRKGKQPGEPLLVHVMEEGARLRGPDSLDDIRERFLDEFDALDDSVKQLENPARYPVETSAPLQALQKQVSKEQRTRQIDRE